MNCPHCGQPIKGVNHNDRGWRCEMCWGFLGFDWEPEPDKKVQEPDKKELEPDKKEPMIAPKPASKAPRPVKK